MDYDSWGIFYMDIGIWDKSNSSPKIFNGERKEPGCQVCSCDRKIYACIYMYYFHVPLPLKTFFFLSGQYG